MNYSLILSCIATLYCIQLNAQIRLWTGGGSNNLWSNSANWKDNIIPGISDSVLLDNSIIKESYTVNLPGGTGASARVIIKNLTITPAAGKTIECILPSDNKETTNAFKSGATGTGYGLIINNGGTFKNSYNGSSNTSVTISDSMQINNGGKYTHATLRAADNFVTKLSKKSGTENGTFEFDPPTASAYSIPITSAVFGNLLLSATATDRIYNATTGGPLTIKGNLTINTTTTINFSSSTDSIVVKGNYTQNSGTLTLANTAINTIFKIAGNITQLAGSQISKSGATVSHSIELNGTSTQNIAISGSINGNITFIMNNAAGATLLAPLSLSYKLILQKGQITTSALNLLTLQNNCMLTIPTDSTSSITFINGPLRKEDLSSTSRFLFPVGKNNMHRWLELTNATGNFTVEYNRINPYSLSSSVSTDINNISGLEYWTIKADASPTSSALVKLSFDNVNSGSIPDLSKLLVAKLSGSLWTSIGRSTTTGTPATNGSITAGTVVSNISTSGDFFTLATDISQTHPLPLKDPIKQAGQETQKKVLFTKLLYTNPSVIQGTTTQLTVLAEKEEPIRIALTNKMGQPARVQQFFLNKGNNKLMLDLSGLASGIYQVTGYTAEGSTNTTRCIKL